MSVVDVLVEVVADARRWASRCSTVTSSSISGRSSPSTDARGGGELELALLDQAHDGQRGQALRAAGDAEPGLDRVRDLQRAMRQAVRLRRLELAPTVDRHDAGESGLARDPVDFALHGLHSGDRSRSANQAPARAGSVPTPARPRARDSTCFAMYCASRPRFGSTSDESEYWNNESEEVRAPAPRVHDAAVVPRSPVVPRHRQVDPAEVRPEPGAPDDVRDVPSTRSSSSTGCPSRTPTTRGSALDARLEQVSSASVLHQRISPVAGAWGPTFRPIAVSTPPARDGPGTGKTRNPEPCRQRPRPRAGICPVLGPAERDPDAFGPARSRSRRPSSRPRREGRRPPGAATALR